MWLCSAQTWLLWEINYCGAYKTHKMYAEAKTFLAVRLCQTVLDNGNTCPGTGHMSDHIHQGTQYRTAVLWIGHFVHFYLKSTEDTHCWRRELFLRSHLLKTATLQQMLLTWRIFWNACWKLRFWDLSPNNWFCWSRIWSPFLPSIQVILTTDVCETTNVQYVIP